MERQHWFNEQEKKIQEELSEAVKIPSERTHELYELICDSIEICKEKRALYGIANVRNEVFKHGPFTIDEAFYIGCAIKLILDSEEEEEEE